MRWLGHLLSGGLGLIRSQAGHEAGEGVAYLKSVSPELYLRCHSRSSILALMVDWHVHDDLRRNM